MNCWSLMNNILITGHSFIRRYHDYLNCKYGSQINYNNCLGLPCQNIYIAGKGGLKADKDGLNLIITKSKRVKPDLVVIELGTNDLAIEAEDEIDQVNKTLHYLFYICEQLFALGVQKIVLCEVIKCRRLRGNTTQAEFDRKQQHHNSLLHNFNNLNPNIIIWKHERSKLRNLKDTEITSDQIHITTDHGFKLYNFSIRAAIIRGLKAIKN